MFYRECGQFKTTYAQDNAIFPLLGDRRLVAAGLLTAFVGVPIFADEYLLQVILIPVLVYSLFAIGLNILLGYCGQLSLGTAAFGAVGCFCTYKMTTAFPGLNIVVIFFVSGLLAAIVGTFFGIPSLKIKGFYLAVTTLAAQFFINWLIDKVGWFVNDSPSGSITAPPRKLLGIMVTGPQAAPEARYLLTLAIVVVLAFAAKNLVRGPLGRSWMAVRDNDIAAELIGIRLMPAKLLAFAVSSFYIGVAGALAVFTWLGAIETGSSFRIGVSFDILFMVIIGGLGSILGSFLGAAFFTIVPVLLTNIPYVFAWDVAVDTLKNIETMLFGGLIIFFLVVQPLGLARLWQISKEKLRRWPFPY